jgi:hypothetical protein
MKGFWGGRRKRPEKGEILSANECPNHSEDHAPRDEKSPRGSFVPLWMWCMIAANTRASAAIHCGSSG